MVFRMLITAVTSTLTTITNYFRPHKVEATKRITYNTIWLVVVFSLTNLLPLLPSLQYAVFTAMKKNRMEWWEDDFFLKWACIAEATIAAICAFNICEALLAIQFPRAPLPPATPAKSTIIPPPDSTPNTANRPFAHLAPFTTPQMQRPFASYSSSFSSIPSSSLAKSKPPLGALSFTKSRIYLNTPLSTPSRELRYSVPSPSFTSSASSSVSSIGYNSPSPLISAYKRTHDVPRGYALDESFAGMITPPAGSGRKRK